MPQTLANDIARCDGLISTNPTGFGSITVGQAECVSCLRRTAPRPDPYWGIEPPAFENGKCPMKIEPKENNGN